MFCPPPKPKLPGVDITPLSPGADSESDCESLAEGTSMSGQAEDTPQPEPQAERKLNANDENRKFASAT